MEGPVTRGCQPGKGTVPEGCVCSQQHWRSAEIKLTVPCWLGPLAPGSPRRDSLAHEGIPFVAALQLIICQNAELWLQE